MGKRANDYKEHDCSCKISWSFLQCMRFVWGGSGTAHTHTHMNGICRAGKNQLNKGINNNRKTHIPAHNKCEALRQTYSQWGAPFRPLRSAHCPLWFAMRAKWERTTMIIMMPREPVMLKRGFSPAFAWRFCERCRLLCGCGHSQQTG